MCKECQELVKAIDAYIEKADKKLSDQLKTNGYLKADRTLEYANEIEEQVAELLEEEGMKFINQLKQSSSLESWYRIHWPRFNENDGLTARLTTAFRDNLKSLVPELVGYYVADIDPNLSRDLCSKRTIEWVEKWSSQLAEMMRLNNHKEIESILTTGIKNGSSIEQFSKQIWDSGIRNTYSKARRVALTEVLRAHSVAAQEAYMQSPSVSKKMWRHSGMAKIEPRWNHVDMDGQIVGVDEPFELIGADGGSYAPMFPRDPSLPASESVNCHCISQPIVDESVMGLSLEERLQLQKEAVVAMDESYQSESE